MDMISIDLTDENQSNHNTSNISGNSLWQTYYGSAEKSVSKLIADNDHHCSSQSFLRIAPLNFTPEPSEIINIMDGIDEEEVAHSPIPIALTTDSAEEGESTPKETELSEAEKKRREEEESERLAWELMRQDQNELYQIQLEYMRSQAEGMSEEDMHALELVLQEATGMVPGYHEGGAEEYEGEEGEEEEEEEETDEEDPNQWDYERLLELGNVLGGQISPRII